MINCMTSCSYQWCQLSQVDSVNKSSWLVMCLANFWPPEIDINCHQFHKPKNWPKIQTQAMSIRGDDSRLLQSLREWEGGKLENLSYSQAMFDLLSLCFTCCPTFVSACALSDPQHFFDPLLQHAAPLVIVQGISVLPPLKLAPSIHK